MIVDEPIAVKWDPGHPEWIPENPDGVFKGPSTPGGIGEVKKHPSGENHDGLGA